MGEKEKFWGDVGKELLVDKVYDDVLHPPFAEVGNALQGAVRIALAPISALVWGYEKIAKYLDKEIPKYFENRKISKEKIQTPPPEIAVPTIEALRYANKGELKKMYVDLLGASMNRDTIDFVHPSFAEIIKQITPDEAKILKILPNKGLCEPLINIKIEKSNVKGSFVIYSNCGILGYEAECDFPDKIPLYIDNMSRLSLIEIPDNAYLVDEWRYNKIIDSEYFHCLETEAANMGKVFFEKRMIGLTDYGDQFRKICLS